MPLLLSQEAFNKSVASSAPMSPRIARLKSFVRKAPISISSVMAASTITAVTAVNITPVQFVNIEALQSTATTRSAHAFAAEPCTLMECDVEDWRAAEIECAMETHALVKDALLHCYAFANWPLDALHTLAPQCALRDVGSGDVIAAQDEICSHAVVIRLGCAKVVRRVAMPRLITQRLLSINLSPVAVKQQSRTPELDVTVCELRRCANYGHPFTFVAAVVMLCPVWFVHAATMCLV